MCNDAELRLERDTATQRLTIERDQLVVHSEVTAPLGLRAMCNRHHLVLAVDRESEPERGAHQLDDLRCQWGGALFLSLGQYNLHLGRRWHRIGRCSRLRFVRNM